MTHHQIPNEICIWKSQMIEFLDSRRKEVAIGVNQDNYDGALYYIRKDAFIKKACKWIKENITNNPNANSVLARNGCVTLGMLVDDFKKYMEE